MKLLTNARFLFGLKSQLVVYMGLTFLMPTLAVHLKKFGYSTVYIGFCFGIPTLCYALSSTFIFKFT
jgi:hypothetical protein